MGMQYSLKTKKHLGILYKEGGSQSTSSEKSIFEKGANAITGVLKMAGNIGVAYDAWNAIETAKKSTKPTVNKTLQILTANGIISDNKTSLLARWGEGSGKIGAQKIIEALEKAEKGEVQIVTYSNNSYSSYSLREYEHQVTTNTSSMNIGAMKGLYSLRGSGVGFHESTWKKIGLYILSRNGNTRLLTNIPEAKGPLMELGNQEKQKKESDFNDIANSVLQKIQSENKDISRLLIGTELRLKPDGKTIDVSQIIADFEKNGESLTIEQIEKKFRETAETIKKNGESLIQKGKDILRTIPGNPTTLQELGINSIPYMRGGKQVNLGTTLIETANPEEAESMIIAITKYQKTLDTTSKNSEKEYKKLEKIKESLIIIREGKKEIGRSGELNAVADATKKHRERGGSKENFVAPSDSILEITNTIAITRAQQESTKGSLKDFGIESLEQAEKKLQELQTKGKLTQKELYLQKLLEQFIRDNIAVSQELQKAQKTLGTKEAHELFTQTNQFVSGNKSERYDFELLNKIATLTDPESTPGEKMLAKLERGETISIVKILEGEMGISPVSVPEIADMTISRDANGLYSIPLFQEKNLTKDQVSEYINNIQIYTDLGLSQFIPHLPLITEELRKKGISTAMDGHSGTMEQQQVLKKLYTLLFGKEIITTNVEEVKRAFRSQLGNPTNMRTAMQSPLRIHRLIPESGWGIRADTLKKWFRTNNQDNPLNFI